MKTLHATCTICGKKRTFKGTTIDEIINTLDYAGWYDFPEGEKIKFVCNNKDCIDKRNALMKEE